MTASIVEVDGIALYDASRYAETAAILTVVAERIQDVDGEAAALVEVQASRLRARVRDLIADAVSATYPDWPDETVDYFGLKVAGQVLRDAVASARRGGAR